MTHRVTEAPKDAPARMLFGKRQTYLGRCQMCCKEVWWDDDKPRPNRVLHTVCGGSMSRVDPTTHGTRYVVIPMTDAGYEELTNGVSFRRVRLEDAGGGLHKLWFTT